MFNYYIFLYNSDTDGKAKTRLIILLMLRPQEKKSHFCTWQNFNAQFMSEMGIGNIAKGKNRLFESFA